MNFRYEKGQIKKGYSLVIGCDEVGRGCLAGPVVAAAVCFPVSILNLPTSPPRRIRRTSKSSILNLTEVKDSKLLTASKREELSKIIKQHALWSIGVVSEEQVDAINIHNASLLAMKKAVMGLTTANSRELDHGKNLFLVIDGKFVVPKFSMEQEAIVKGDNKILSIAAASIIAKMYRDGLMAKLDKKYPIYNFAQHKGYATLFHRTKILQNGLSKVHRKSFCKNFIQI